MRFQIEEYDPSYTEDLRRIFLEARLATFFWLDPALLALSDFDKTTEGERILVATNNRIPVGFIACWEADNFIHSLFVDPRFTGKGVGKLLLTSCLAIIGRPATLKCIKENTKALLFYYAQGWTKQAMGRSSEGSYYLLSYD
jgi:GNAT superfamily N-acetyltransferase